MGENNCEIISEVVPTSPTRLHCVLIHGTFAPDAAWTIADSPLSSGLRRLEPGAVRIHRFRWSGDNTHAARCAAAGDLRSGLRELAARHPNERFLLIGHSHGGNLACSAVSALARARCVGIVTLATPFFHIEKRSLESMSVMPYLVTFLVLAGVFGYVASFIADLSADFVNWMYGLVRGGAAPVIRHWLFYAYVIIAAFVSLVLMGTSFAVMVFMMIPSPIPKLTELQDSYFCDWDQLHPSPVSTLSLSMTLDEAFWGLTWARHIPEYLHRINEWLHGRLAIATAVAALTLGLAIAVNSVRTGVPIIASDAVVFHSFRGLAWAAAAAFIVVLGVRLLIILASAVFLRFTYGFRGIEHHLLVNIIIRRTPQIEPALVLHRRITLPVGQLLGERFGLIHSKLYMDPRSFDEILSWYRSLPRFGSK